MRLSFPCLLLLLLLSCGREEPPPAAGPVAADRLFSLMTPAGDGPRAGVDFRNDLHYTEALNPYTYRNFYNGGGVGIGDFDGDGLQDLYFTGNLVDNRLYLNRGDFNFVDRTAAAGVACSATWSTGVAVVDINADGHQDLYVCKAGPPAGEQIPGMTGVRHNELFINNGDATFREAAAEYGLDIVGLSVHAAFFDYDGDGDLDCYLLNNSTRSTTGYDLRAGLRELPDPEGGNKLLRNDGGRFTDVSAAAGIYTSSIGFGLGVTVGDVNGDHLPDLFVSNDYFERDYLYYNRGDGTFREALTDHLAEISKGSMGADLADLNNDGLPELFVTEMLPADERRYKTKAAFDGWNRYQLFRDRGYHQQFGRNVLQLNRGGGHFSEIGRLAGVAATDWSWGALLCDLDNDGLRDIFVANGVGKDLLDQDYINYNGNPESIRRMIFEEGRGITDVIDQIPSEALTNGVFRNRGDLTFAPVAEDWGFDQPTFSNGSAYGDLDNDGDLDLVVSNLDGPPGIYRNNGNRPATVLRLRAAGTANPDAIGAAVVAYFGDTLRYAELHPMRGFQSTVDKGLHFAGRPDSVRVTWPDGTAELFVDLPAGPVVELPRGGGGPRTAPAAAATPAGRFRLSELAVRHVEDPTTDFDRDPLLFLGLNNEGPALATADVDGDGRTDFYLGGAAGHPGRLFRARPGGGFAELPVAAFAADAAAENVDAVFFDADGDGDPDLYVANGSNQFSGAASALLDVLYLNRGGGRWERATQLLPSGRSFVASGCVRAGDFDNDGDTDLFVGGRLRPGTYGVPADSYLLLNDGRGKFTSEPLPDLGMVTDAAWDPTDRRLYLAAEWAPLRWLTLGEGATVTDTGSFAGTAGLWQSVRLADLDGDGRADLIAGNHGLNSRLTASPERPLELHVNDFDRNGKAEQITVRTAADGRAYPLVLRDDLVKQLPALRKLVAGYADYQGKTLAELFPADVLARSVVSRVTELRSLVVLNPAGAGRVVALPTVAQLSPAYALAVVDLNGDEHPDLLLAGNQSVGRPETGIYAAGFGATLLGNGDGSFRELTATESRLYLGGDVRAIASLAPCAADTAPACAPHLLIARSNGPLSELKIVHR